MDKITILETFFEVIGDSLEWGLDFKDDTYAHFVDGASAMVKELLKKIGSKDSPTTLDAGHKVERDSVSHTKIIDGDTLYM